MLKRIVLLVGIALVAVLPLALHQSVVAGTQETECENEIIKSKYFNNCANCNGNTDPTCDEHWNIQRICGGKVKEMKILTRPCTATVIDPWLDTGWHSFSPGTEPPASGSGFMDSNGNLLVPVSSGNGGVFTSGFGCGLCVNFMPDGGSMVKFTVAVLAQ